MKTKTCQICARVIKANTGLIAHHGYHRPWKQGWQTSSCFGAKYRPYEEACDALPPAIERVKTFIASQKAHYKNFTENPPAQLTHYDRWHKEEVYMRPEVHSTTAKNMKWNTTTSSTKSEKALNTPKKNSPYLKSG